MPGSIGEHVLQERFGTEQRARGFYNHQMLDHLNEHMQEFVGRMEMVFISTADSSGETDCSFRAGPPGFVCVLDERTVVYPEYRGNGVMSSLGNIAENGHIGLLFIDFCGDAIGLHVNGRATMLDNDELITLGELPEPVLNGHLQEAARTPERWVKIDVVEAYIHCSKHIPQLVKRSDVPEASAEAPTRKSGDYFKAKHSDRPWVESTAAVPAPRTAPASGRELVSASRTATAVAPAGPELDAAAASVLDASGVFAAGTDRGHDRAAAGRPPEEHEQMYEEALALFAAMADSWSASLAALA